MPRRGSRVRISSSAPFLFFGKFSKAKQSKAKQRIRIETVPSMCKEGQSLLIDRGKGNVGKVLREQHLADIFRFLGEMGIPGTRGGFPELSGWRKSGAWCPTTKKQGIEGGEAPRRPVSSLDSARGRGARQRRNKGLRAMRHHAIRPRAPI